MARHVERFAPSPTGPLHLGHAFSALTAWDRAVSEGGDFLLRIEDIDQSRARPEWEQQIYEDLEWLGLSWPTPVLRQSERLPAYRSALQNLWNQGLLYACACNRRDIEDALSAPQEGIQTAGPDGLIYPGTCRDKVTQGLDDLPSDQVSLRLNISKAGEILRQRPQTEFSFTDSRQGTSVHHSFTVKTLTDQVGDVIIARRNIGTSYHFSVVIDDAYQGVTHVTRGEDLFEATLIHVFLQHLLGLPTPTYHHHGLIRDDNEKRLAKRDDARAIRKYRDDGATPNDIRKIVGL